MQDVTVDPSSNIKYMEAIGQYYHLYFIKCAFQYETNNEVKHIICVLFEKNSWLSIRAHPPPFLL